MKKWDGYQCGVNLGGWLSQCPHTTEHYETFIVEDDIKNIAKSGADHIRLPIDYNLLQDTSGAFLTDHFRYIDNCITWCRTYQLNMVLDLHKTAGYSFDKGEQESGNFFFNEDNIQQFLNLWKELAHRYGKHQKFLAFELLNEVVDEKDNEPWMKIAKRAVDVIRPYAPTIKIILGSYWNNSVLTVKYIAEPFDENIVYTFHCYEPLIFTHQNAHWMPETIGHFTKYPLSKEEYMRATDGFTGPYHYTDWAICENGFDTKYYERLFQEAISISEKRNVPLYCGEYGVIDQADPVSTDAWLADVRKVFQKYDIGSAVWTYKKLDFGVFIR